MKIAKFTFLSLAYSLLLSGCGNKIQPDLQVQNAKFIISEGGKAQFTGSVKNTGTHTYKAVFVVVSAYQGDTYAQQVSTSADLYMGHTLGPGESTTFSKDLEDGGMHPDRYEMVRLYGTE